MSLDPNIAPWYSAGYSVRGKEKEPEEKRTETILARKLQREIAGLDYLPPAESKPGEVKVETKPRKGFLTDFF